MATIVAAAGGGNWTAGGTWVGGVAPTAADDAQLTSSSGNVTINSAACVARSLDCTGYTGTLTHTGTNTLTLGDGTAGASNIALKLVSGMTYAPASTSILTFASTSATQQSVDTAGKTIGVVNFSGTAGSWILASSLTTSGALTLSAGTLNTAGYAVSIGGSLSMTGSTTRTLTLGASVVSLISLSVSGSGFSLNAGTSSITCTGTSFATGGLTYYDVTLAPTTTVAVTGTSTFNNLTLTGTAATSAVTFNFNPTVNGTFTASGGSQTSRILVMSSAAGSARTITAATVSAQYADFRDITGAGAGSWNLASITGGSGDGGGNSGITFTTGATQYAVGITGSSSVWSTSSLWASSSGGSGGTGRVPLMQDDVVIDANSGSGTKFANDTGRVGKNLTWNKSGIECNLPVSGSTYITGSITITSALSLTGATTLTLLGRGTHTFDLGGLSCSWALLFQSVGGTYTQSSAITLTNTLTVSNGTFDTNNYNITCTVMSVSGSSTRAVTLGTSVITLTTNAASSPWNASTVTGLTFSGASSTIVYTGVGTLTRSFAGGGLTYGTFTFTVPGSTGALSFIGNATFGTFNFSDASNARTINVPTGTTQTFTNAFNVSGTSGKLITISGVAGGSAETLVFSGPGVVSCDYLSISNCTASPGSTWYAGANSTDGGGNSGWIFTAAPAPAGYTLSMII